MPLQKISILLLLCTLLFACQDKPATHDTAIAPVKFAEGYKVPEFDDAERKVKIAKASTIIRETFKKYAQEARFPAMAYGIVMDNDLILTGAMGFVNLKNSTPASSKSLFRIASMTKSFTAMAIVKLRDDGKLKLDDLASNYIPELANIKYLTEDAPGITVRNLLTMTAGFPEDNPWGDRQLADTQPELLKFIEDGISFSNVPSKEFEYSNLGYALLGQIITNVSGMTYEHYISKNLLEPLGMSNTKWEYSEVDSTLLALGYRWEDDQWKEEPLLHDGTYGAMGGLITSVEDFSKYVMFHLSAWPPRNGNDSGPVKRSSLREMHKPWQFRGLEVNAKRQGHLCPTAGAYGYGLGWRRDCEGVERLSHSGGLPGFGSDYRFYPEYGFGIICFANLTYASAGQANGLVMDTLFSLNSLSKRELPVSDTLQQRATQVMALLKNWDKPLESKILAENFYLDLSRDAWIKQSEAFLKSTGNILKVDVIVPENQLRGKFRIDGELKDAEIFFTLTPEASPKIQQLDLIILEEKLKK
ncbi:MAG: serine hydrolase domain-containing protein [Chryseolinea sp.]